MKRKILTLLIISSMTLLTGCGSVTIGLKKDTPEDLSNAKIGLEEAKEELQDARDEINQKENISKIESNISNWVIDMAEKYGIGVAEKYIDYKLEGDN